jgi:hypothetical protein
LDGLCFSGEKMAGVDSSSSSSRSAAATASGGGQQAAAAAAAGGGSEWFSSSVLLADHRHRLLQYHPVRGVHVHLHSNAQPWSGDVTPLAAHEATTLVADNGDDGEEAKERWRRRRECVMPLPAADKSIPTEWQDDHHYLPGWGSATRVLQAVEVSARVMRRCLASLQDPKTGTSPLNATTSLLS